MRRLRRLHREGFPVEGNIEPHALLTRLQAFHRDLSSLYANKIIGDSQIRAFLDGH
jgi:hypothetical protein